MIRVVDLSGEHAITTSDGEKLFEVVQAELKRLGKAELDFVGIRVYASPFFNASIGRLLKAYPASDLMKMLSLANLSSVGATVLARVVENAEQYYRNPKARKAVDSLLEKENTDVDTDGPGDRS